MNDVNVVLKRKPIFEWTKTTRNVKWVDVGPHGERVERESVMASRHPVAIIGIREWDTYGVTSTYYPARKIITKEVLGDIIRKYVPRLKRFLDVM